MFRNFLIANAIIIVMIKCSCNTDGTLEYHTFEGEGSTVGLEPKSDIQDESFKEINKSSLGQPLKSNTGNPVSNKDNKNKRRNTYKKDCLVNEYTEGSGTNKRSFKKRCIINQIKNSDVRTDDTLNLNAPSNDYVASHKSASEQSARLSSVSKSSRETGKCIRRKQHQPDPSVNRPRLEEKYRKRVSARIAEMQSEIPNTEEADLQHAKSISSNGQLTNTNNNENSGKVGSSLEHATKPRYNNCGKSIYCLKRNNIRLFDFVTFFKRNRKSIITLDGWLDGRRNKTDSFLFAATSDKKATVEKMLNALARLLHRTSKKKLLSEITKGVKKDTVSFENYRPNQFYDLQKTLFTQILHEEMWRVSYDTLRTLRQSAQNSYELCIYNMNKAEDDNEKAEHLIIYLTIFLEKHEFHDFYILRSELWNLQMIMPEFYLYLVWKIKQLKNYTTNSSERLFAELNHLHCLLLKFIDIHDKKGDQINDFEQLKKIVDNYRLFIFNELATGHRQEMCYFFYDYAMKCSVLLRGESDANKVCSDRLKLHRQMVMYQIFAFAFISPVFTKLCSDLIIIESNNAPLPDQELFITEKLIKHCKINKEALAALQLMIEFINICKIKELSTGHVSTLFITFEDTTVVIAAAKGREKIVIQFLSPLNVIDHFYDLICLLIERY